MLGHSLLLNRGTVNDDDQQPDVPRWVKLLLLGLGLGLFLLIAAMLVFGGDHGPGRHFG